MTKSKPDGDSAHMPSPSSRAVVQSSWDPADPRVHRAERGVGVGSRPLARLVLSPIACDRGDGKIGKATADSVPPVKGSAVQACARVRGRAIEALHAYQGTGNAQGE